MLCYVGGETTFILDVVRRYSESEIQFKPADGTILNIPVSEVFALLQVALERGYAFRISAGTSNMYDKKLRRVARLVFVRPDGSEYSTLCHVSEARKTAFKLAKRGYLLSEFYARV